MRIVQISDTHLTESGPQASRLAEAIAWINALEPPPLAILHTGDTVDAGRPAQYAVLREVLAAARAPVFVVPGNHDRRERLHAALGPQHFPGTPGLPGHVVHATPDVCLVGLDTAAFGRVAGRLDGASLAWLEVTLRAADDRPVVVFMHHPPFRTGVNAADWWGFRGVERFRRIVAAHRGVRLVVAGHVHCVRGATIGAARAATTLSTSPQPVPELFERRLFGLRPEPGGFAVHTWRDDAFVTTTLVGAGAGRFAELGTA